MLAKMTMIMLVTANTVKFRSALGRKDRAVVIRILTSKIGINPEQKGLLVNKATLISHRKSMDRGLVVATVIHPRVKEIKSNTVEVGTVSK